LFFSIGLSFGFSSFFSLLFGNKSIMLFFSVCELLLLSNGSLMDLFLDIVLGSGEFNHLSENTLLLLLVVDIEVKLVSLGRNNIEGQNSPMPEHFGIHYYNITIN